MVVTFCEKCKSTVGLPHRACPNEDIGEEPYLTKLIEKKTYNPNYGDDRMCVCNHPYERHFDSYEDMMPIGCKYCECYVFVEISEPKNIESIISDILQEDDYDPGLLTVMSGENEEWWKNYVRAQTNSCNRYWRTIVENHREE